MNVDELSQQIAELRSRVRRIWQRTATQPNSQQELIIAAFDELQMAMEELLVALEELEVTRAAAEIERQRYQELFDFAPDGYLVTNTVGKILEANYAAAIMLCVRQKYLVGKPLILFIAQQDHQIFSSIINNSQQREDCVIDLKPRLGTSFPASIRASPVYYSQEKLLGWRWSLRNISETKKAEEQMAKRTVELAKANQQLLSEVTEHKRAKSQLMHLAFHDVLTGLPNRALFMNRLEDAVNYSKQHSDYLFAVLFLDLDRFKVINDSLGHTFGDQLLLTVAQRLQQCLRSIDIAARLGGDEFIILLVGIKDVLEVVEVVERIQKNLAQTVVLDGHEVSTTASIGIALSITGYKQPEDYLRDADIAMYRAKAQGRACYEIFNTDMHLQAMAHLQLVNELRRAIELQEFRVYYQPIVSLSRGRITGFEALVRWLHPKHGIVLPEYFISTAQETGLIILIEQWLLYEACSQIQQWQEQFSFSSGDLAECPLTISVNLCTTRFSEENLLPHINKVLQDTGLPAQNLTLEITEGVIMENHDKAIIRVKQLRNLGIKLAIDDFGTGYSSLGRLHHFPINQLKIDRSFVSGSIFDDGNLDIVQTIITLAHKLGVNVTAEGVETEEQLAMLRKLKCEYGQGYFFSHPLDSSQATALIMANPQW
ncbi:diguanylate cyclase/phosphodiesterase with PAS/PAC and GAF sensor(s) [Nostoc commune NIES-4072]|uniref:Diguanylate cyclase/phosphodiesterase with PAS/PAC and GAF sensor(S) n=1 Tax=Nostoc commune NIES-4072 TaxID=2005467 RepID=A0A2R5FGR5_NOSCO|nr:EAL domain-containing protein [Nostoc commune]BBD65331.1 diguanylate cyclase/phosphodiesterase with PAS/PAC and GAF sensor(s) [Nostoc commune HK-02]GBG17345.1 diguanylate cyclase/phosphodiesterase with PAS/PAC and GAF sensor(s) [Nostoc commune NIES-4072]